MSGVVVRPARVEDAGPLARCQGTCWAEAYSSLVRPGLLDERRDGIGADRWRDVIAGGTAVAVAVAPPDDRTGAGEPAGPGEVVGFASAGPVAAGPDEPRPFRLHAIYLRRSLHGTGTADRLVAAVLGDRPASLWVFEDNPRARAFYARHGFVPDGTRAVDEAWTGLVEIRMVR